jgi:hypothetical protein
MLVKILDIGRADAYYASRNAYIGKVGRIIQYKKQKIDGYYECDIDVLDNVDKLTNNPFFVSAKLEFLEKEKYPEYFI